LEIKEAAAIDLTSFGQPRRHPRHRLRALTRVAFTPMRLRLVGLERALCASLFFSEHSNSFSSLASTSGYNVRTDFCS
jgi:hypothetical protein